MFHLLFNISRCAPFRRPFQIRGVGSLTCPSTPGTRTLNFTYCCSAKEGCQTQILGHRFFVCRTWSKFPKVGHSLTTPLYLPYSVLIVPYLRYVFELWKCAPVHDAHRCCTHTNCNFPARSNFLDNSGIVIEGYWEVRTATAE